MHGHSHSPNLSHHLANLLRFFCHSKKNLQTLLQPDSSSIHPPAREVPHSALSGRQPHVVLRVLDPQWLGLLESVVMTQV
jgi:hypothetical protein